MISASQSKLIRSLRQKKYREQHRLYVGEGHKMVTELMAGMSEGGHRIQQLFATGEWIQQNQLVLRQLEIKASETSLDALKKISSMVTPQPVLVVVAIPERTLQLETLLKNPVLGFEAVRDPGNLGTIIRTADWFGIGHIICSPDSVDVYNPKVVQATMGAITRVNVYYLDIKQLLLNSELKKKTVYGTYLEGNNIYGMAMDQNPLILFGNESQGLSHRYDQLIGKKISIPSFSRTGIGSESLNLASSVAVVCSELRRAGTP
jgi:TrmH family RNA methyltransferase